jgi:hypothetical protein
MDTKRNVYSFLNCLLYTLYLQFESLQITTILLSSFFLNLKSFPLRILYCFTAFLKSKALQNVFLITNVGLFISLKSNGILLVTSLRGDLHYPQHSRMVTLTPHCHPCIHYYHSLQYVPHFYTVHHFHHHYIHQHL